MKQWAAQGNYEEKNRCMPSFPNYAGALRCIGQALASRNIEFFEILKKADEFLVEYGDPDPPYTEVLKLHFSLYNIEVLDREGQARRRQTKSELRFDSLPEILRATGKYVDSKQAQLRRLNNCCLSNTGELELEYQTRAGDVQAEMLVRNFIREAAVSMYSRRNRISNPINILTRRS